jgi:hypothetical protein
MAKVGVLSAWRCRYPHSSSIYKDKWRGVVAREGIEDSDYLAESEDVFEGPDRVTPDLNP